MVLNNVKVFAMLNKKILNLFPLVIIILSCVLSFIIRLFSIISFESIIHEFDPWFNYRSTLELVERGFYKFLNWFDEKSWYPLGRIVGGTIFPGLMMTSGLFYNLLKQMSLHIEIRNVCVLLAPLYSCFTVIISFLLTKEIWNTNSGLICGCIMAIVPGYISRSSSGSYDNEGIAIFAMLLTFYFWIKATKTGTVFWSVLCSISYFYMVSAWGGYVYTLNLISLHVIILLLFQKYSNNLYVAFSVFYLFGLLFSMQIPFVGFQPLKSCEHASSACAFFVLQFYYYVIKLEDIKIKNGLKLYLYIGPIALISCALIIALLTKLEILLPWSGRFYSLWDINYAAINIPIITSVSEHQPTAWQSTFFDLNVLMCFYPAGIWFCFKFLNNERIFLILYALTASYFSSIMVRLVLALTPAVAIGSSISFNMLLTYFEKLHKPTKELDKTENFECVTIDSKGDGFCENKANEINYEIIHKVIHNYFSTVVCIVILIHFSIHSIFATSTSYSNPSIVMSSTLPDGNKVIIDDFREAYYWLKQNTKDEARIMSWWDYGYQITGMANRTTIVDNNTWNNSHIALVGKAMSMNETNAIKIIRLLDVDYVLVIFGGLIGFSGDDINKFLWMVRISEGEHPKEVYEYDYFTANGEYRIDKLAPKSMVDSLMYRLSYYRFGQIQIGKEFPTGYDRTRNAEIGLKYYKLKFFEEAFTSENWLVRIYKTKLRNFRISLKHARKKNKVFASQKRLRKMKGALKFPRIITRGIKKNSYPFT